MKQKIKSIYYNIDFKKINRLLLLLIVSTLPCITVYSDDCSMNKYLTIDEAMDIILEYHGIETEMDISNYLTLDADDIMTREAAVTAVIRSYGVYPIDNEDYIWDDENEQDEKYKNYIDYAWHMGITFGVSDGYFLPKRPVSEWEMRTMLERANGIKPTYQLSYNSPLCKLLSADIQRGLSDIPDFLIDCFYRENRIITVTKYPIIKDGIRYIGWIYYEGNMRISSSWRNHPLYDQEIITIHEFGHYLGHKTKLLNRHSVPEELDWLINFLGEYCNENNHEFFAESFVVYILYRDELQANAPNIFNHIQKCLKEMENIYELC